MIQVAPGSQTTQEVFPGDRTTAEAVQDWMTQRVNSGSQSTQETVLRSLTAQTVPGAAPYTGEVITDTLWKPYSTTYFLPKKDVSGPVQLLLGTRYISILLSRPVYY